MAESLLDPIYGLNNTKLLDATATEGDVRPGKTFYAGGPNLRTGNMSYRGNVFLAYGFNGYLGSFTVSNCYAVVIETWGNNREINFSTSSGTITENWQDGRRYFLINNINGSATIRPSSSPRDTWMVAWGFRCS